VEKAEAAGQKPPPQPDVPKTYTYRQSFPGGCFNALIAPLHVIAREPHATLLVGHTFGTRVEGGAFESVYLTVAGSFGVDLFDLEDLDAARTRFEALRGDPA
jgi:hypothetical protein